MYSLDETEDNNKIRQWTIDSTRELIRMYGKYGKKFSSVNQGEKHLLWKEIAQQFSQLGYHYSANTCNDKWRNLKMTYKKNKQRASKYGLDNVKWFYYKDMENIIKDPIEESMLIIWFNLSYNITFICFHINLFSFVLSSRYK